MILSALKGISKTRILLQKHNIWCDQVKSNNLHGRVQFIYPQALVSGIKSSRPRTVAIKILDGAWEWNPRHLQRLQRYHLGLMIFFRKIKEANRKKGGGWNINPLWSLRKSEYHISIRFISPRKHVLRTRASNPPCNYTEDRLRPRSTLQEAARLWLCEKFNVQVANALLSSLSFVIACFTFMIAYTVEWITARYTQKR